MSVDLYFTPLDRSQVAGLLTSTRAGSVTLHPLKAAEMGLRGQAAVWARGRWTGEGTRTPAVEAALGVGPAIEERAVSKRPEAGE